MNWFKNLLAKFLAKTEEVKPVSEVVDQPDVVAVPVAEPVVTPVTDLSKLKALLVALGHAVEAEWDQAVALATK